MRPLRIKCLEGKFIPQWKGWFLWHSFYKVDVPQLPWRVEVKFDTEREAWEFLRSPAKEVIKSSKPTYLYPPPSSYLEIPWPRPRT